MPDDRAILLTLESFRDDLASGRLDGDRGKPASLVLLDPPCPACRGTLVTGRGRSWCLGDGCRYSWRPAGV